MNDLNRPLLGEPNAPCRTCGSPLAADQRYCLQCGARRTEARLPFLDILARQVPQGAPVAATGAAAAPPSGNWFGRLSTNAVAVAGVACLLLALGVGVLIGGLGQDETAASGTPQVISVGGGAAAPAAPVAATTAAPAATETTPDAGTDDGTTTTPKSKSSNKTTSSSDSKTTNNAVKNLDSSAGGDYTKKSEKLPKTLGTGGAAPPVDKSKPVGGGSDVESIG